MHQQSGWTATTSILIGGITYGHKICCTSRTFSPGTGGGEYERELAIGYAVIVIQLMHVNRLPTAGQTGYNMYPDIYLPLSAK